MVNLPHPYLLILTIQIGRTRWMRDRIPHVLPQESSKWRPHWSRDDRGNACLHSRLHERVEFGTEIVDLVDQPRIIVTMEEETDRIWILLLLLFICKKECGREWISWWSIIYRLILPFEAYWWSLQRELLLNLPQQSTIYRQPWIPLLFI